MRLTRPAVALALMTTLALGVGCSEGSKVASITIEGEDPLTFAVIENKKLPKVILKDSDGNVVEGLSVKWTSSKPAIADVVGNEIIPKKNGSAVLTPKVEGSTATARLGVLVTLVDSLALKCIPRSCEGQPGDRMRITVDPKSEGNTVIGVDVKLESEDENVAAKEGPTDFRLKKAGTVQIKATLGPIRKRQMVRVRQPPPDELWVTCPNPKATWKVHRVDGEKSPRRACKVKVGQVTDLKAQVRSMGKVVPLRTPDWSVGNSTVVNVDGGLVTGLKPGTEVVRVSIEGLLVTIPLEIKK